MTYQTIVLVTGATGQQGGAVARELFTQGYTVKALTRKPDSEKAKALEKLGITIVRGDLDDPDSLERATKGAWGVFSVQNTWEAGVEKEEVQGKRLAEIAKKMDVQHFVYSSVGSAHRRTGIPHFDNKWRVEETVRTLGFPSYTIIRPVFFMDNFITPWFKPGIDQGKLFLGLKPDTVLQMIAVEDIGKYGRWVLDNHKRLNGKSIDIAGDARTMPETAKIIGDAAGRKIGFVQTPIEEVRKQSEEWAVMLEWFDEVGYEADIASRSVESGIKPTTLMQWASKVTWSVHQEPITLQ